MGRTLRASRPPGSSRSQGHCHFERGTWTAPPPMTFEAEPCQNPDADILTRDTDNVAFNVVSFVAGNELARDFLECSPIARWVGVFRHGRAGWSPTPVLTLTVASRSSDGAVPMARQPDGKAWTMRRWETTPHSLSKQQDQTRIRTRIHSPDG